MKSLKNNLPNCLLLHCVKEEGSKFTDQKVIDTSESMRETIPV